MADKENDFGSSLEQEEVRNGSWKCYLIRRHYNNVNYDEHIWKKISEKKTII